MNFIFISPNFPKTYEYFCRALKKNGVNVLGLGDAGYDELEQTLKDSLTEYYKVNSLENYDEVFEAVKFFYYKYGKIDFIESNNEYWLEQDARLRSDFKITTGIGKDEIEGWKHKSLMKQTYYSANIPSARQHKVTTKEEGRKFLDEIGGYPVIVKPDVGVGSGGAKKINDDSDFNEFYSQKDNTPYVMEEYIFGDVCSYDAIINSKNEPLFESMTVWPPSIADIVNNDLDLSYYVTKGIDEKLKNLGRKTVKAFNVKSRFVHLEFFRLTKPRKGIGEIGDYAALEVNMRPAGGYTPDMMNFAHSADVYQIWSDMITTDKRYLPVSDKHYYCVYASRKPSHKYKHTHEEIIEKYGKNIVMCEKMPRLMWETMGCQMYTVRLECEKEIKEFVDFVQEREE